MFKLKFLSELMEYYKLVSLTRQEIIHQSNLILRQSKQIIFALHRKDFKQAQNLLEQNNKIIKNLTEKAKKDKDLSLMLIKEGSFKAGIEEYLEAAFYYSFLKKGQIKIDLLAEFNGLFWEEYLGGLCDFTGELVRMVVNQIGQGKKVDLKKIKETISEIEIKLIDLNMTGKLRVKYDDLKRNLKRIEEISYDLKIRGIK